MPCYTGWLAFPLYMPAFRRVRTLTHCGCARVAPGTTAFWFLRRRRHLPPLYSVGICSPWFIAWAKRTWTQRAALLGTLRDIPAFPLPRHAASPYPTFADGMIFCPRYHLYPHHPNPHTRLCFLTGVTYAADDNSGCLVGWVRS